MEKLTLVAWWSESMEGNIVLGGVIVSDAEAGWGNDMLSDIWSSSLMVHTIFHI